MEFITNPSAPPHSQLLICKPSKSYSQTRSPSISLSLTMSRSDSVPSLGKDPWVTLERQHRTAANTPLMPTIETSTSPILHNRLPVTLATLPPFRLAPSVHRQTDGQQV
ncbi:hypothetical protein M8818_005643 [Zalaria obscura]|uniref:Uncharacterized protein n=1 Tax=Zalaria obscura TaxID=2024903 RepID=A0ACC3S953_9PEZI